MPLQTVLVLLLAIVALVLWPLYLLAFRDQWRGWGWTMYFCLSWGMIAAPLLTLMLGLRVFTPGRFPFLTGDLASTGFLGPTIEEALKGLALVGVVLFARLREGVRSLSAPILALLGGTVGFGFGFTEALVSGWPLGGTESMFNAATFGIELVSGYLHVAASGLLGGALGWALERRWVTAIGAGLAAFGLHILNNSAVVLGQGLGLGLIAFLAGTIALVSSNRTRTRLAATLRPLLRAALPIYLLVSAIVVAAALATATASALGDQLSAFLGSFTGYWSVVGLVIGLGLIALLPGLALVIMYEVEEVYLAWDEVGPGEESPFLTAHALRDWIQGDEGD